MNSIVFLITVNVFKPKKSNLTKPTSSEDFISNWVTGNGKVDDKSLYKGTISSKFLSPITTPAACVATFLYNPSSFSEKFINFLITGSFFSASCNLGSMAIDSANERGLDGSKGIILHN